MKVFPVNYVLEFEPIFKNFTFIGKEIITVECKDSVNTIIMHCAEIKIKSCRVINNDVIQKAVTKTDANKEELVITIKNKIKGCAFIEIEFTGDLNDRLLGFYRSQYKQNGKTKYLATTQFEAADARRAFPCWDEPEAKATFEISIIAENKFTAISNMPIMSKKRLKNKTLYKFAKTPIMSTYLIYLGVGEFEYLTGKIGKVQVRVITTKGNKSKGKYSLELGKKLLSSYEKYFGIKYPLPKLDLIAIPDFAAGAMENWGAITFRETILLYDPKTSSTRTKQYIAEVISHEIAHQWFGNLVTMKWWNDLWLNESFATFMATKFVDKFYPEWDLWNQFVDDAMNNAMALDSLKNTHPIDVKVNSTSEIREIFDAISYDKGGCVLRMLEHYVGESNFQKGLKKYLAGFKYKNAEGKDLWDAIGKISKMPVRSMVQTWLKQPGFPVVEIEKRDSILHLKQRRYVLESDKKSTKGLWFIPLSIGLQNELFQKLFTKKSMSVKLPKDNIGFVANFGRKGFYRVKYDEGTLIDLKMLIDQKQIPAIDRWAIQNDLFSLCVSGDETVRNYLDFSDAYYDEDSYLATVNVAHNLTSLYFRAFDEDFSDQIKNYTVKYLKKILHDLGWDPKKTDKHTDALMRGFVIFTLGKLNDEEVTIESENRYKQFLKNQNSLPPDLVEPVCSVMAWNGNSKTHAELTRLYRNAKTTEEKLRFLGAMCSFKDPKLLLKSLNFSQTSEVRSQNMQLPIMKVAGNPYGKKILWPWLKNNWPKLSKKVGRGNPLFNRIVASISSIADDSMEKEIRQFFKKNPTPGTERTQEQTLERIRINSKFLRNMRKEFS
ncbi:M1 family metallopeptidase [Nitrosarchaeum koreense]|uniref:Aminopeptidase n=1 Tax=Nitrosarchaeum koreense MY1 TaxID=1001994 RepID=F9CX91_9ARCH|nr:M1 family metallopeptidase [Nitrosarchaeum koreense]EGP93893.1 Peptidase M1 membrane alanine aminopeptidase [Nitrosarchaeum koreense MY1]